MMLMFMILMPTLVRSQGSTTKMMYVTQFHNSRVLSLDGTLGAFYIKTDLRKIASKLLHGETCKLTLVNTEQQRANLALAVSSLKQEAQEWENAFTQEQLISEGYAKEADDLRTQNNDLIDNLFKSQFGSKFWRSLAIVLAAILVGAIVIN